MKVTAIKHTRCPMEGQPKKYISDHTMVEVPNTAYYRRLVKEGSLATALTRPEKKPLRAVKSKRKGKAMSLT